MSLAKKGKDFESFAYPRSFFGDPDILPRIIEVPDSGPRSFQSNRMDIVGLLQFPPGGISHPDPPPPSPFFWPAQSLDALGLGKRVGQP